MFELILQYEPFVSNCRIFSFQKIYMWQAFLLVFSFKFVQWRFCKISQILMENKLHLYYMNYIVQNSWTGILSLKAAKLQFEWLRFFEPKLFDCEVIFSKNLSKSNAFLQYTESDTCFPKCEKQVSVFYIPLCYEPRVFDCIFSK